MPIQPNTITLADTLREAIRDSAMSYHELARLAKVDQGTISRFMLGQRDLTLAVASRLCLILGFGLTRVGSGVSEPLDAPPPSNRKRSKKRRPPASAVRRGQGRRIDLEGTDVVPADVHTAEGVGKRYPADRASGLGGRQRKK